MIQRVNSYTAHRYICTSPRGHKYFTLCWIKCLMRRATMIVRQTRRTFIHEAQQASPGKRFRFSNTNPQLPAVRHSPNVSHVAVISAVQGKCLYCRYQYMCSKIEHPDDKALWGVIRQPQRKCIGCGVYLCKDCFGPYHE